MKQQRGVDLPTSTANPKTTRQNRLVLQLVTLFAELLDEKFEITNETESHRTNFEVEQ